MRWVESSVCVCVCISDVVDVDETCFRNQPHTDNRGRTLQQRLHVRIAQYPSGATHTASHYLLGL